MRRRSTGRIGRISAPVAFVTAGVMWLGLTVALSPTPASAGTPLPGAPNCPMFPADNVWNTPVANLPVNPQSAAWLASMDAGTTNLHPDFGPSDDPSTLTPSPTPSCPPHSPTYPSCSSIPTRATRGRTRSVRVRPLRAGNSRRGSPRHHGQSGHVHPRRTRTRRRTHRVPLPDRARTGTSTQCAAPGRMDIGGRGGPTDPPRPRALRRGAVGRHHPRHQDDSRDNGHVIHLAGPPRGGGVVEPGPAAHGGPLPAQG